MPQKHSKNANSSMKFGRNDFNTARNGGYGSQFGSWHDGWQGTLEQRVGSDAHMPFGYCALSLQPCVDPVVSPSGNMYSREFIYEYLLNKKKELERQRKLHDKQQAEAAAEQQEKAEIARENELQEFLDSQEGIVDKSVLQKQKLTKEQLEKEMIGAGGGLGSSSELTEKRKEFLNSSFWVPTVTPDALNKTVAKPEKRPRSPMSGQPLKLKDLIPIKLLEDSDGEKGSFICAVSKKELKHQKVVLIKSSGQVMLRKCFDELAKPEMKCPVTGISFKEEDVIDLKTGGTGFSAHNEVVAKRYRPSM